MSARTTRFAASIFAIALAPVAAAQQHFGPNHVFVCSYYGDRIVEFDEESAFVRDIGVGSGLDGPRDAKFGPDGLLYVTSQESDRVLVFDATGAKVNEIGSAVTLDSPAGLAFGPDGVLYVGSFNDLRVVKFDAAETVVGFIGENTAIAGPSAIDFGMDGHVFVAAQTGDKVMEFDPADVFLRELKPAGLDGPAGLAFSPAGRMLVSGAVSDSIYVLESDGSVQDSFSTTSFLGMPHSVTPGPDGTVWVCATTDDVIHRFISDVSVATVGSGSTLDFAAALAFAPFQLDVRIDGALDAEFAEHEKLKIDCVLSWSPGSRLVTLTPVASDAADFVSLFAAPARLFRGVEIPRGAGQRRLQLSSIGAAGVQLGVATAAITVEGKNKGGFFKPKSVSGSLQVAAEGRVFSGKIKSK